ncbi:MAG: F0F1 ATP synthase subunit B [Tissierellia bacterium]|nr:F0F1 ATP synthase subunit B [Tissierellia bacterium]
MQIRVIPELKFVILQLVATGILFIVLWKLLYNPVSRMLEQRKERIQENITNAEGYKEEALRLKEEYEMKIAQARKEAQDIIESGRKRGEEIKENIVAEARDEAKNIIERAKREIEAEKEKALLEIKNQSADMALLIASRIIEEEIGQEKHQKLIDKFIDEVGSQKWQI